MLSGVEAGGGLQNVLTYAPKESFSIFNYPFSIIFIRDNRSSVAIRDSDKIVAG